MEWTWSPATSIHLSLKDLQRLKAGASIKIVDTGQSHLPQIRKEALERFCEGFGRWLGDDLLHQFHGLFEENAVGCPCPSRWMLPFWGSGVEAVIPASRRA